MQSDTISSSSPVSETGEMDDEHAFTVPSPSTTSQMVDTSFRILSPNSPDDISILSPPTSPSAPRDGDLRAGSVRGVSLRASMEFRNDSTKSQWRTSYFSFNELTCSIFRSPKPGDDPVEIFEISGVINKQDRLFKRKHRFDLVTIDTKVLSLSAPTSDVKKRFMETVSRTCEPTNAGQVRQLRMDMAAESRKVIALTTMVDKWKAKFKEVNRRHLSVTVQLKDSATKVALDKFIIIFTRRSAKRLANAFNKLKFTARQRASSLNTDAQRCLDVIKKTISVWQVRQLSAYFMKWIRLCVVENVKSKISSFERQETLKLAKNNLEKSVTVILDVGEARRQEIRLMEAELDALDAEVPPPLHPPNDFVSRALASAYTRSIEQCENIALPTSPALKNPNDNTFGPLLTPDIHIFSDDEPDDDDQNLSFVPSEVKKIERKLSLQDSPSAEAIKKTRRMSVRESLL